MEPKLPFKENRGKGLRVFAAVTAAAFLLALVLFTMSKISSPSVTAMVTPSLTASPVAPPASSKEVIQLPTVQPISSSVPSQTVLTTLTSIPNLVVSKGSSNAPVVIIVYSDFL